MYDPPIPDTPSALVSVRMLTVIFVHQLTTMIHLAEQRDAWQYIADTRAGAVELYEEAEKSLAYWRQRALDAEALVDALRRAQSMHTCRTDSSKETS